MACLTISGFVLDEIFLNFPYLWNINPNIDFFIFRVIQKIWQMQTFWWIISLSTNFFIFEER